MLIRPETVRANFVFTVGFCTILALGCRFANADTEIFHDKFISLGTATVSGTFQLVGTSMCDLVNKERSTSLIRCVPYNTVGSDYNAKAVANGDLTMALTNAEIAYNEFMRNKSGGQHGSNLRAVMSLHLKPIMVIARGEANIADVTQLAGHSINLGNVGSGQRHLVEMLLKSLGLSAKSFSAVLELNATKMGDAFCQGKVEVIVESLGNPSPFYKKMIEECNGTIVMFPPAIINKLMADNPMMSRLMIPGRLYRGYPEPIPAFGDTGLLVTSSAVSDEAVSRFVGSIMDNLNELRRSTPEVNELAPDKMFSDGITIPLHPGVISYLNSRKMRYKNADFSSR